jgi:hypothetical protein
MAKCRKPITHLPAPCRECRPFGGAWRQAENGGMERCSCPRGQALVALRKPKVRKRPASFDPKMAAAGKD